MIRSLGDLVDRLSIVNLKLWFVQDQIHKAAAANEGVPAEVVQKLTHLNLERSRLMTSIDETLGEAVQSGTALVEHRVKLT